MRLLSIAITSFIAVSSAFSRAESGDVSLSFLVNEISQPVTFENSQQTLTAINTGLQLSYNKGTWSIGVYINQGNNDISQDIKKRTEFANLQQNGHEIYFSYYLDDWSLSTTYGQHETDYSVANVLPLPNQNRKLVEAQNKQFYDSKESYFIVNLSRWFDLSNIVNQLAFTPSVGISYVDSSGQQGLINTIDAVDYNQQVTNYLENQGITPGVQRQNTYTLSDDQVVYDLSLSLDYMPPLLENNWFFSAWISHEFVSTSDGTVSTRLGNGQRVIQREFPLDETGASLTGTSVTSYGVSVEYSFSDDFAATYGLYESDVSERQWQFSLSYFY